MSKDYTHGTRVEWDWGDSTAEGKIDRKFTEEVTRTIKGSEITRHGSADNPAYLIKQEDGGEVLKLASEIRKAG